MQQLNGRALSVSLLLWALAAPVPAIAQEAAISGTVTDTTGLVLPGVTVHARDAAGDREGTAVTDGAGVFTIALPPGSYGVTFTLPGFQEAERDVVEVGAGAAVTLDVELAVELEELVVVVGSRAQPRSVTESPVPIDAIPFQDVVRQGATTLDYQLRTLIPSFNVATHPISDAATLVRPATLRNLAHDHTLVLVNGKRRHRSSVVAWFAGVTDGAQGPDISTIPSIALRQVEVLRDGASAQYGSDAIAGVLNFLLKDDRAGGSLEVNSGAYRAGDGDAHSVAGNAGLPIGNTGFANLSFEYGNADPTDRSVQRDDAAALIAAGNTAVADPAQIWGNPTIEDDLKLFANFGNLFANGLQLYGHANYADKKVTEGFYFRNPNTRQNIYTLDGGQTLLIGDVLAANGMGSANCPTVRITDNVPDQAALAQVFADPDCFSFQEIAPGGFTPRFGGHVSDMSAVAGLRRVAANGLIWDASASFGAHESDFFFENTVNASLGPETPRDFDPGLYRQEDVNLNFDVSYAASDRVNVAAGAEWRNEGFTVGAGGRPAWEVGPFAAQGFVPASNGFPGFADYTAGTWNRNNVAFYGDLELRGARRPVVARRRRPGGALRPLRRDDQRQAVGPHRAERCRLAARRREHRVPRADPRPAEHDQRADDAQRSTGAHRQRHRPFHVRGGAAPRRRPAPPGDVAQLHGRAGGRQRTVHADRRLLPRHHRRSPGPVGAHRHRRRGSRAPAGRRHHRRRIADPVPVLHKRLLHPDPGHRRGLHLDAARPVRRHRPSASP